MRPATSMIMMGSILLLGGSLLWLAAPGSDRLLFDHLRLDAQLPGIGLVRFLSVIGSFAVLGPLALAAVAWLYARKRRAEALWLFCTIGGGRLAVEISKDLVARPRPPLAGRLAEVSSLSFPSSHSAGTLLTWLALAMLFPHLRPWLLPFAALMALAIGWSRIALGVHWPSDVIAGYGAALLVVGIAGTWMPLKKPNG